jgi:hypothetical protein
MNRDSITTDTLKHFLIPQFTFPSSLQLRDLPALPSQNTVLEPAKDCYLLTSTLIQRIAQENTLAREFARTSNFVRFLEDKLRHNQFAASVILKKVDSPWEKPSKMEAEAPVNAKPTTSGFTSSRERFDVEKVSENTTSSLSLLPEKIMNRPIKKKKVNMCGHPEREHYAKNMCNNCYHRYGRNKKPWLCTHERLYAHGLCQNCYINKYNKNRSLKAKKEQEDTKRHRDHMIKIEESSRGSSSEDELHTTCSF